MEELVKAVCRNDISELGRIFKSGNFTSSVLTAANFTIPPSELQISSTIHGTSSSSSPSIPIPANNLTLMHIAAYCDSLESFIFLKGKGLRIQQSSAGSYLPIHYACLSGAYEIVTYILTQDPDQAKVTPQVDYHLIYLATMSGDPEILQLIFDNGADINAPANKKNKSVQQAIKTRHVDCLRILLEKGSKNDVDTSQFSTLMLAITNNEPDAVPLLLDSGEQPEYVAPTFETALSLACFQGFTKTVRLLCSRMSKIDIDPTVRTKAAVHWICTSKDPEIVQIVLSKGINVNRLDKDGHTGLYYILDIADESVTIQILEQLYKAGLNLNIQCKSQAGVEQNSILGDFMSSIYRPMKVIEWLLMHGASAEAKMVSSNKRIIDFVMNSRNKKLIDLFKKWCPNLVPQGQTRPGMRK